MGMLDEIFARQREYLERLKPIERQNGFEPPTYPLNIDDKKAQEHLRVLAWRINEEIYETLWEGNGEKRKEEISDILHFLVEFYLAINFYPKVSLEAGFQVLTRLSPQQTLIMLRAELASCMRVFRQRPWRGDDRPTNRNSLQKSATTLFEAFMKVAATHFKNPQDLCDEFFAKAAINDERQKAFEP